MTVVSAPGNVFVAGEWAVLEPGNAAVVAAINRRMQAHIGRLETVGKEQKVVLSAENIGISNKEAK